MKRIFLAVLCMALMTVYVSAAVISIPDDFGTIQEGLNAASTGDTVVVRPGTYSGEGNVNLWFGAEDILLMSQDGPEATILDGGGEAPVRAFELNGAVATSSFISGFTIRNFVGSVRGGAVLCSGSAPVFKDCVFAHNSANTWGGAIYCINEATPQIIDCEFSDNHASQYASYAGAVGAWTASPYIENCLFKGNSSGGYGGAIFFAHGGTPTIKSCRLESNSTVHGGALGHYAVSGTIENSVFLRNEASQKGGAVFLQDHCSPEIRNCTFFDNSGATGGVFFIEERFGQVCSPVFENSLAAYNRTSPAFVIVNATPTFECTDVYGNVSDWSGYLSDYLGVNGNISANPIFCDTGSGDVHIEFASPCAPDNNECENLIGAETVGCGYGPSVIYPNPVYAFYAFAIEPMTGYCLVSMENENHDAMDIVASSIRINSSLEISNFEILPAESIYDVFRVEFDVAGFIGMYPQWWDTVVTAFAVTGEYSSGDTFEFPGTFTAIGHTAGDANGDKQVNVGDAVFLINYIFRGGPPPLDMAKAEINCDGHVNVGDVVHLISFIFREGLPPGCH